MTKKEIASKFNHTEAEEKWYKFWIENNYFKSTPDSREPYTIVIPPPNVTGVLHMGHMLNNTLQDILIRRARMKGYNACWVPGTDHASIATEAKVVNMLKEKGLSKEAIGREKFLEHAWEWTEKYGGTILEQLKKIGCSCDWDRTKFTLDESMTASVIKVFVDLFEDGLIYKDFRLVNWDPKAKTTLSDEEVIYKEQSSFLYHINYPIKDSGETITVATTRPETIFGDVAICISPNDDRYKHLVGKKAVVPICNREIPIIEDEYVDPEFGTGCLKITPAHDENDYKIGLKYNLEMLDVLNEDATLNEYGLHYKGKDRFVVRKEIAKELEENNFLAKKEKYTNKVGTSERTGEVIESRLSHQWFLKMEDLVKPAIKSVLEDKEIALIPTKFENTYRHWLDNIRDWNISRQLWWGHRIPVYYLDKNKEKYVVAETKEEALEKAQKINASLTINDLTQEEDVLDTWFSSWLWPISVFDGISNPENEEINYYYPTQDLVTGPDILFFWVARMIISGYKFRTEKPFSNVYLTGLVRDNEGKKMSKQLGNSPDVLKLIDTYGADSVRVGLMLSTNAGNDLLFDESLCQQGKNFVHKIWNSFRLIKGWEVSDKNEHPKAKQQLVNWYENKFYATLEKIEKDFENYRISDALMNAYKLIWDDFCSWFLEGIKRTGEKDSETHKQVWSFFKLNLQLLHPFMPFLTEELWQLIKDKNDDNSICISSFPKNKNFDKKEVKDFEYIKDLITKLRSIRKEKNISFTEKIDIYTGSKKPKGVANFQESFMLSASIEDIKDKEEIPEESNHSSFLVGTDEYFILTANVDAAQEREKLQEELSYLKGFLLSVEKKLSNERFVSNAPEKVVEIEKKKQQDTLEKIASIEKSLKMLS